MHFSQLIPVAHAAYIITPFGDANPGGSGGSITGIISTVTDNVVSILLLLGGSLAVIYLMWSGIQYITAGGSQDKAKAARQAIINAITGIIVIMAVFFIIRLAATLGRSVSALDKGSSGTSSTTSSTTTSGTSTTGSTDNSHQSGDNSAATSSHGSTTTAAGTSSTGTTSDTTSSGTTSSDTSHSADSATTASHSGTGN